MLSKHASLSIKVVTNIFNSDCANPFNFSGRFVCIYSLLPLWSLKIQRHLPFLFPSDLNWDTAVLCISFVWGTYNTVCYCFISTTQVFRSCLGNILSTEISFVVWTEDSLFPWFPDSIKAHLYVMYALKRLDMSQEINPRWDVRTENIRQPF